MTSPDTTEDAIFENLPSTPWKSNTIPWDEAPIWALFKVVNGSTPSTTVEEYWDGSILWATPEDLPEIGDSTLCKTKRSITKEGYKSCGTRLVPRGSLILTTRAPIGKVAKTERTMCTNQGCKSLVPLDDSYSGMFWFYIFMAASDYLDVLGEGATFSELGTDDLKGARLPVPSSEAQARIASFLDHHTARIDQLIGKKQRLLELLEEKRQAVITRAVTAGIDEQVQTKPVAAPSFDSIPANWSLVPLKYLSAFNGGKTPSTSEPRYWRGDIPWFTAKDMKSERLDSSEDNLTQAAIQETGISILPEGSVIVVVRGMILDHTFPVGLTKCPGTINQDMKALLPDDRLSSEYLFRALQGLSPAILALVGESAHGTKKIESEALEDFELPLPPPHTQAAILDYLDKSLGLIENLTQKTSEAMYLLNEKREALITAAVTGQIDVTDWEPLHPDRDQTEAIQV